MFEIGNSLREARVRQGLDYPEIELATKVRAKYLHALEDEQFELLPAQPYVKGFLRTYAEFLGLDGQLYVDEYNSRYVVDALEEVAPRRVSPRVRQQRGVERKVLLLALLGKGTYVEVRRSPAIGHVLYQGTVGRGKVKLVPGSRFWLYVRRPARVDVSLGGKPVALPARRNLRVYVTPTRTARAPS